MRSHHHLQAFPEARQPSPPSPNSTTEDQKFKCRRLWRHSHSNHLTTDECSTTKLHTRNQLIYIINIYCTSFCAKIMRRVESQRKTYPTGSFQGPPSNCEASHKSPSHKPWEPRTMLLVPCASEECTKVLQQQLRSGKPVWRKWWCVILSWKRWVGAGVGEEPAWPSAELETNQGGRNTEGWDAW